MRRGSSLVERGPEKAGVGSSILLLGTILNSIFSKAQSDNFDFTYSYAIISTMNTQTMRIIDYYAGNTICFFLSKLDQIVRFFL